MLTDVHPPIHAEKTWKIQGFDPFTPFINCFAVDCSMCFRRFFIPWHLPAKIMVFFFGLGGPLDHFLHVVVGDLRGFLQVVDDGSVATDHRIADAVDVTFADGKQQIWVGLMSWPRRMRIVTSDSLKVGRSRGMSFPCPLEVLPFNASA